MMHPAANNCAHPQLVENQCRQCHCSFSSSLWQSRHVTVNSVRSAIAFPIDLRYKWPTISIFCKIGPYWSHNGCDVGQKKMHHINIGRGAVAHYNNSRISDFGTRSKIPGFNDSCRHQIFFRSFFNRLIAAGLRDNSCQRILFWWVFKRWIAAGLDDKSYHSIMVRFFSRMWIAAGLRDNWNQLILSGWSSKRRIIAGLDDKQHHVILSRFSLKRCIAAGLCDNASQ